MLKLTDISLCSPSDDAYSGRRAAATTDMRRRSDTTTTLTDGADHAFNRDPDPPFDPAAAALAWQRTLAFFTDHLQ